MIDYALLCQAIADWKGGRAPSVVSATPSRPPPAPVRTQTQAESYEADDVEEYEEVGEEVGEEVEEVVEQTVIYQLPIEPVDDDELL